MEVELAVDVDVDLDTGVDADMDVDMDVDGRGCDDDGMEDSEVDNKEETRIKKRAKAENR